MAKLDISAVGEALVDDARALLREYAAALPFSLDFQNFDAELAELPASYAPPGGMLLVARDGCHPVGCVALRALDTETCEMKRLFIRPSHRGAGLGRTLATRIIDEARRLGYRWMRLDTVPGMEAAQALYEQLGFVESDPYTRNPVPGARFLRLKL